MSSTLRAQSRTSSDYYSKTAWTDRAPLMVQHGYDILESATAAALPEGYKMADYQAGMWVWLRGSA